MEYIVDNKFNFYPARDEMIRVIRKNLTPSSIWVEDLADKLIEAGFGKINPVCKGCIEAEVLEKSIHEHTCVLQNPIKFCPECGGTWENDQNEECDHGFHIWGNKS
jgi:hypothetical protein